MIRTSRRAVLVALALTGLLALPVALEGRPFELRMMILIFLFATMGQGWNVLGGLAGQVSIGHGLYFGLGAYTTALLAVKFGVNPWLGMTAAMVVPALAGVLIGLPCFRLKGHYFVIATLVVAESVYQVFTVWDWAGSAIGIELPMLDEGWSSFQFHRDKRPYYYIALAMLLAVTFGIARLRRSGAGLLLTAIRDDEAAARSLGVSATRLKSMAMAVSAGVLGLTGAFHAQFVLFIDPPSVLGLHLSVMIALFVILGGIGTLWGPVLGAAILVPLSEYSRVLFSGSGRNVDLMIYGVLIMVIALYRPQGLVGTAASARKVIAPRERGTSDAAPAVRGP